MVVAARELNLLFAHQEYMLRAGDFDAQRSLIHALIDRLRLDVPSEPALPGDEEIHPLLERGVPVPMQASSISIPHRPVLAIDGKHKKSQASVAARINASGDSVIFRLTPCVDGEEKASETSSSDWVRPVELTLTARELAALAGVPTSRALRLAPAFGRLMDRIYLDTVLGAPRIDKTLLDIDCRMSDMMVHVKAEAHPRGGCTRRTQRPLQVHRCATSATCPPMLGQSIYTRS